MGLCDVFSYLSLYNYIIAYINKFVKRKRSIFAPGLALFPPCFLGLSTLFNIKNLIVLIFFLFLYLFAIIKP